MVAALRHRGPDAKGVYVDSDGPIAVGHNGLSIIDLSAAGRQPMVSDDGRYRGAGGRDQFLRVAMDQPGPDAAGVRRGDAAGLRAAGREGGGRR